MQERARLDALLEFRPVVLLDVVADPRIDLRRHRHAVDGVKMPQEIFVWAGEWVEKNYKPKPFEKRIKPRSFLHPKDRV